MMKRKLLKICALICVLALGACAAAESGFDMTAQTEIDMLAVDHKLYELGYRDGACNGILDEVTINALRNFQIVNGLDPTGEPDQNTVSLLLSGSAMSQKDYLVRLAQDYAATPALANGSYGDGVSRMQRALKSLGYFQGSSDGAFGEATEAAVYRFQLANGLRETGVADDAVFIRLYCESPISWDEFLQSHCASVGDSGSKVRTLQVWLKHKGYFHGECTGRYGEGTQQAVKAFQMDCELEPSGDADLETCRMLYWNVEELLADSYSLRPGETGNRVETFCRDLAALGYPAHGRFNMQTELALMQFQLVNGLDITGVADAETLKLLNSENAKGLAVYRLPDAGMPDDEKIQMKMYRQAAACLGRLSELDTPFGFVQYTALKCGVELMDPGQLIARDLEAGESIAAGMMVGLQLGDREICGIATSDGAILYRADSGYIVIAYLEAMEAERIWIYQMNEEV